MPGREYMVTGFQGVPVTPKFKFRGMGRLFKVEITYTSDRDKLRDLRALMIKQP